MPNGKELNDEIAAERARGTKNAVDVVRRKYLKELFNHTGRNVIAYYSGWLQQPNLIDVAINDKCISGFMLNVHTLQKNSLGKLDTSLGLDLILHTPGGDLAATESLVTYLKKIFGNNIRAIVPLLSMSAGTIIALSCKEIIMGKHSSLGPIDPQINGMPCEAIISEFDRARKEILNDPNNAFLWEFIISKYHPSFLNSCQNAIDMSNQLVRKWLLENMCAGDTKKANKIRKHFSSHKNSKIHARHISIDTCKQIGVKIVDMEADSKLQDLILTVHHAFMQTFQHSRALKIIENHNGIAYAEVLPQSNQMPFQFPLPIQLPPQPPIQPPPPPISPQPSPQPPATN